MERREEEKAERKTSAQRGKEEEEETTAAAERISDKDEGEDGEEEQKDEDGGDEDVDSGHDTAGMKTSPKKNGVGGSSCSDRKCIPGIIYLGHIPPRLRPKHLRNMLSGYGEIGRIFLQPEDGQVRKRKRRSGLRRCDFTEGWVEFTDKRIAKRVAASLHNTPMGTRKRQRFTSDLWAIKYLHRFQWTHLSERLAYEQTVLQQRLRTEVSQAKRETNFYLNNVERSAHLDNMRKKMQRDGRQVDEKTWDFTQHQTEDEIQMKKKKKKMKTDFLTQKHLDKARLLNQKSQSNVSLLAKIFNSKNSDGP